MTLAVDILPTTQAGGFLSSPRGFPASLRAARFGFHRPWSYPLSTGFKYRKPHGMDVLSPLDISIVMSATLSAPPRTDSKSNAAHKLSTPKPPLHAPTPPPQL